MGEGGRAPRGVGREVSCRRVLAQRRRPETPLPAPHTHAALGPPPRPWHLTPPRALPQRSPPPRSSPGPARSSRCCRHCKRGRQTAWPAATLISWAAAFCCSCACPSRPATAGVCPRRPPPAERCARHWRPPSLLLLLQLQLLLLLHRSLALLQRCWAVRAALGERLITPSCGRWSAGSAGSRRVRGACGGVQQGRVLQKNKRDGVARQRVRRSHGWAACADALASLVCVRALQQCHSAVPALAPPSRPPSRHPPAACCLQAVRTALATSQGARRAGMRGNRAAGLALRVLQRAPQG